MPRHTEAEVQAEAPRTSWRAALVAEYEITQVRLRIVIEDADEDEEYI